MPNLEQLTKRQRAVYEFIRNKMRERGYGPTVREIGREFDIRSPNGVMCHLKALERKGLITREPNMSRAIQLADEDPFDTGLPLAGRIAAGRPLEAIEQGERLSMNEMFGSPDLFALQVNGESMVDDHIADGDYVVVKKQESARDGQTVVALLETGEATLKRWYREKGRIRLEPANAQMKPIYASNVKVLGILVGVIRRC